MDANIAQATGIITATGIIQFDSCSFTLGSGHPAIVIAPPDENGDTEELMAPTKMQENSITGFSPRLAASPSTMGY